MFGVYLPCKHVTSCAIAVERREARSERRTPSLLQAKGARQRAMPKPCVHAWLGPEIPAPSRRLAPKGWRRRSRRQQLLRPASPRLLRDRLVPRHLLQPLIPIHGPIVSRPRDVRNGSKADFGSQRGRARAAGTGIRYSVPGIAGIAVRYSVPGIAGIRYSTPGIDEPAVCHRPCQRRKARLKLHQSKARIAALMPAPQNQ